MVIFFSEKNPEVIIGSIKEAMGGRQLGKMVSFNLQGNEMTVVISKLGTSTLTFNRTDAADGCQYSLVKEKIALAHKPLQSEVKAKILKVIRQAGGQISET